MAETMRDMLREGMREIQRELASMARTSGSLALPAGLLDRMEDFGRNAGSLNERLQTLERSVNAGMQEGARNWAALGDRLKSIDKLATAGGNADIGEMFTTELINVTSQVQAATEKLQGLERTLETKLRTLDEGVNAARRDGTSVTQVLNERFQAVRQQLEQQSIATASLVAQLTEPVTERLRQLESGLQRQVETLASRPVDTGLGDRIERALAERIAKLEQAIASTGQVTGQAYQLTAKVDERVRGLEGFATAQPQATQALVAKLAHVEQLVQSHGDRAVQYTQQVAQQAADARIRELGELQEAIVKLGTNQQTLSESLDQWRTENEGGLSIVSNRLEVLEAASAQPMQMLRQMQTDLIGLQKVTVADYDQNRRGIRNWLFGTEDLFAGSWRDETRQIRERIAQVREERAEARKA
jgi:cell division protein ZapA (FtsZ GTPase activity inhibitor)